MLLYANIAHINNMSTSSITSECTKVVLSNNQIKKLVAAYRNEVGSRQAKFYETCLKNHDGLSLVRNKFKDKFIPKELITSKCIVERFSLSDIVLNKRLSTFSRRENESDSIGILKTPEVLEQAMKKNPIMIEDCLPFHNYIDVYIRIFSSLKQEERVTAFNNTPTKYMHDDFLAKILPYYYPFHDNVEVKGNSVVNLSPKIKRPVENKNTLIVSTNIYVDTIGEVEMCYIIEYLKKECKYNESEIYSRQMDYNKICFKIVNSFNFDFEPAFYCIFNIKYIINYGLAGYIENLKHFSNRKQFQQLFKNNFMEVVEEKKWSSYEAYNQMREYPTEIVEFLVEDDPVSAINHIDHFKYKPGYIDVILSVLRRVSKDRNIYYEEFIDLDMKKMLINFTDNLYSVSTGENNNLHSSIFLSFGLVTTKVRKEVYQTLYDLIICFPKELVNIVVSYMEV